LNKLPLVSGIKGHLNTKKSKTLSGAKKKLKRISALLKNQDYSFYSTFNISTISTLQ
jgi:hypothetical protein